MIQKKHYFKTCSATLKSKLSDRSANPSPRKLIRPESSAARITKYLELSDTVWTLGPGYASTAHWAWSLPEGFSSRRTVQSLP